jgi:hypothetical protein
MIKRLQNELYTLILIYDLKNATNEFVPYNQNEFVNVIKEVIDNDEKLLSRS